MTKKTGFTILAGLLFAGSAVAAGRSEVLVTSQAGKGSTTYALDFYSDGSVAGFQFDLEGVGTDKAAGVDVSNCGVSAPAGFQGGCTVRDGFVRVLFFSAELKSLPEGWHDLGTVSLKGSAKDLRLKEVKVSDSSGKAIATGARIEGAPGSRVKAK